MAAIQCPMCGKENSSDLDACQFCQARLKPLLGQQPPDESGDALPEEFSFQWDENQSESDIPQWLQELRSEEGESQDRSYDEDSGEAQSIQTDVPSTAQEDRPEWLSDLRDEAGLDTASSDPVESEDAGLSDLVPDLDSPTKDEQLPEWLEGLRSQGEIASLDEQEEDSDWLDRIRRRKEDDERIAYQSSFNEAEDAAESVPSFSSLESEEQEIESQPPVFDIEEPGPSIEPAKPISQEGEQPLSEADFWLEDETPVPTPESDEPFVDLAVPAFDEAVTSRLDELSLEPQIGEDESSDAVPDWLTEEQEEPQQLPADEPDALPDWLADVPEEPQQQLPADEPDVLPDWIGDVPEEPQQQLPVEEPDALPDWIADEVDAPETPVPRSEEMPDWLTGQIPDESPPLPSEEQQLAAVPGDIESGEAPNWLVELGESPDAIPTEDEISEIQLEKAAYLPVVEDAELLPSDVEELAGEIGQEVEGEQQPDGEQAEPDLTPADLPAWLEAMRPVETAAPGVRDADVDIVEIAGPLAGLSGVLSAKPEAARRQKDSAYTEKLQVSQEQRAHVDLLEDLIEREGKPSPVPKQSVISPQNILRWVIALVLILAILWPVIIADLQVPMPTFSQEIADVNSLINNLPEDARLLVAFDYQPGLAAEMDTTAAAVLDHIMLRGAYLTLVSTSPTGPLIAERFLAQTQSAHNYTNGEQYINMGFIPGGAAGLLSLAVSPQRTIPYTTDGVEAWEINEHDALAPLHGIGSLADFSMVLVIVDDPDVARAWVEQVQPYLVGGEVETPLVMAVSAQTEPLMRPYYEASPQQLQGFVAGIRGGASYARLTGRGGLPSQYWDAFSTGLTVAAVLIAIGGIVNVASILISRRDQSEGEAQS